MDITATKAPAKRTSKAASPNVQALNAVERYARAVERSKTGVKRGPGRKVTDEEVTE